MLPSILAALLVPNAPIASPVANTDADADDSEEEEEEEELQESDITLHNGMFFDGTGNNCSNSERVFGCFAPDVNLEDAAEDIRQFCAAHGYDGKGSSPDNSYGNDVSNVARLYELYIHHLDEPLSLDAKTASLPIYIDGIGTSSTEEDSTFSKATGLGAQGVRARVEQTPPLILNAIQAFKETNPDRNVVKIEFDIFGFSRGAATARDFAVYWQNRHQPHFRETTTALTSRRKFATPP